MPDQCIDSLTALTARLTNARVLELGCGNGQLVGRLYDRGTVELAVGLDPSLDTGGESLTLATRRPGVPLVRGRVSGLPLRPRPSFHLIIALESAHLFTSGWFDEVTALLLPSGVLAVAWIEFGWEAELIDTYHHVLRRRGADPGAKRYPAQLDLQAIARYAKPSRTYGRVEVSVSRTYEVERVVAILASTSAASACPEGQLTLATSLLNELRRRGYGDPLNSMDRHHMEYVRCE